MSVIEMTPASAPFSSTTGVAAFTVMTGLLIMSDAVRVMRFLLVSLSSSQKVEVDAIVGLEHVLREQSGPATRR